MNVELTKSENHDNTWYLWADNYVSAIAVVRVENGVVSISTRIEPERVSK
jgi:hypothetical protein